MLKPNFRTGLTCRLPFLALFAVAALVLPTALRADTVTYDLAPGDTLQTNVGPLTGTITVNFSAKTASATLFVDGMTFTCTNAALFTPGGNTSEEALEAVAPGGAHVVLAWSIPPAGMDPNPLLFSSTLSGCQGCTPSGIDFLSPGDSATIPEPSTALLLIPGLAAVLPFARRFRAKA
jgi:hypothetical protein